ncbi:tRNA (5-methylaminomethyl-2-thiouridine)(34)-methyltransferase MnmD [Croceimicrobium sp.]|uniref:tRNA (5-methylaminomethyl-2-thiouridine)(34)-methyltransferase MnmD n=1 Tax=Croceimicrobium sp. TaxID=2828340 RepID=UPI003BAD1E09
MNRYWVKTKDGSPSLYVPELQQNYHSLHGALQESRHVFIDAGLKLFANQKEVHILEIGFGTGLNALLSHFEKFNPEQAIHYHSLEKYPLQKEEWQALEWPELFTEKPDYHNFYLDLHKAPWEQETSLRPDFSLLKNCTDLRTYSAKAAHYDLIYFDAFSPEAQPELWSESVFREMYNALKPGGRLVSYCVKGSVRRAMKAAQLEVEKIPGPPGKREMARALKEV